MSPRSSTSGAYPPRSSVRSSFSGPATNSAHHVPYNPTRSALSRSPSPQHYRRSPTSSPGASTRLKNIAGNGTAAHPWNCEDECELVPNRNIQHQTGGSARGMHATKNNSGAYYEYNSGDHHMAMSTTNTRSAGTVKPSDDEYDKYGYSDFTSKRPGSAAAPIAVIQAPKKEDAYQRYLQQKEQSSCAVSSSQYTPSLSTSRSASPSMTSRPSSTSHILTGSRSASPSTSAAGSRSSSVERYYTPQEEEPVEKSAAASAKEMRARRLATQKSSAHRENDLRLQSHNPAVQAYLARKEKERIETVASSRHHQSTSALPPRRASPSPSRMAEKQRRSSSQGHSRHPSNGSMTEKEEHPRSRSSSQRREQKRLLEQQQQQRRSSSRNRDGSGSSGRPPAFQQPKSASPNEGGGTTFTYQFQPEKPGGEASTKKSSGRSQKQIQKQRTAEALAAHKKRNGQVLSDADKAISNATTSVTRARRLLQSSSSTSSTGSATAKGHPSSAWDSQDPMSTHTARPKAPSPPKHKEEKPRRSSSATPRSSDASQDPRHRRSSSGHVRRGSSGENPLLASTTSAPPAWDSKDPMSSTTVRVSESRMQQMQQMQQRMNSAAAAPPPMTSVVAAVSAARTSSTSAMREVVPKPTHARVSSEPSVPSHKSSSGTSSTATRDCSVTRARRLLQEGRGRDSTGEAAPAASSLQHRPPIATAASTGSSSSGGPPPPNSQSTNSGSAPTISGTDTTVNKGSNDGSLATIPRSPRVLRSIPSNLENDNWSVRVCIISAVDFPVHVVPNMPLSPVLKLGLVSIPAVESTAAAKDQLLRDIDRKGLCAVSEEMRCTTTKLLSKRDNGAVEFHEELRWDRVALKPGAKENLALAVELCARGVLRPANLHESPPPHNPGNNTGTFSPRRSRANTPTPGDRPSIESGEESGVANSNAAAAPAAAAAAAPMRPGGRIVNMFRKSANRKGKADSAMESAQAAAAVAKLLVQGSTSPMTNNKDVAPATNVPPPPPVANTAGARQTSSSQGSAQAPQEWDVTLKKAPESIPTLSGSSPSAIAMTDDIRLGSLLIPLTDLDDLQRVLTDRSQTARLEKWFEVQNMNAAVMNNQEAPAATNPGRFFSRDRDSAAGSGSRSQSPASTTTGGRSRRNPSILLELSLYSPEVLDESEDEMDEEDLDGEDMESSTQRQAAAVPKSFAKRTTLQVRNQLAMQSKTAAANAANTANSPKKDKREEEKEARRANNQDPFLEPGIVDYISIVGARDIGNQKQDDGSKGWVQSTPECCVLEQFPPTDDFHCHQNPNRLVQLPQKVEWFCFPEGVKLWRGPEPPSASDFLSQQQQQQSSSIMTPSQIMVSEAESTSLALFDAYLNCTTSFNWFVIASNSEDYGSHTCKTFGAVIRFYVPAPRGIDPTQDDFAQTLMSGGESHGDDDDDELWLEQQHLEQEEKSGGMFGSAGRQKKEKKRLWVPIGICVTSSLPIVGIMEAVLMRACEMLASRPKIMPSGNNKINNMIQRHLANLILNFQQPIAGALNCSVPFLLGESLQVRLPSRAGLPPLPHGNSVASVCRLLGPEGFIFVLAALLTESKILLHSHNTANTAMVAEVMTALLYPFTWSLPYVPVLPMGMLEFVEAPLSYLLGIPSCCMEQNMIDPMVLEDIVVVDLDNGFSSPDWKTTTTKYKSPTPLPSLVASNISRAVYRLLRALENEHDYGEKHSHPVSNASDRLPRIQAESKAEREFRIAIALEMGGLVRGYQDCLVFVSTSQPVFNREKFLKRAPALFIEEPSGGSSAIGSRANKVKPNRRILSSRSKRFLSILVNCQHFHQFLESLRSEECAFFHEVMEMWIKGDETPNRSSDVSVFESSSSFDHTRAISHLSKSLLALEERITAYDIVQPHSNKPNGSRPEDDVLQDEDYQILSREQRFPRNLLQQIDIGSSDSGGEQDSDVMSVASKTSQQQKGVHHASLSVQYLVELEKNPWRYKPVLDISVPKSSGEEPIVVSEVIAGDHSVMVKEKVKLRDAIGDRKFRTWKISREQAGDDDHSQNSYEDAMMNPGDFGTKLDLASLMTSATEDTFSETSSQASAGSNLRSSFTPEQQRVANAKDRDVLRRCLEKAYAAKPEQGGQDLAEVFNHHGRDLVSEAEVALRNPSAQHFLLSLLSKRSKLDEQKESDPQTPKKRASRRQTNPNAVSSSRLEPIAFECVVRLCCAMLDSCMETKDYEPAYLLLCHTAGLFTLQTTIGLDDGEEEHEDEYQPMYMTARIGLHPLFADLGLWQKVMSLHLAEKHANIGASERVSTASNGATDSMNSLASLSHSESFENDGPTGSGDDEKEYEAAVATLYEMLGYGIPAEELARFATKVSQQYGWFSPGSERGQSLLLLARRLSMRRELAENGGVAPGEAGDLDMMQTKSKADDHAEYYDARGTASSAIDDDDHKYETIEIGWCHPAAPSLQGREAGGRGSGLASMFRGGGGGGGQQSEYMSRSAVTALATFGPSVVVSGGLDGGVFLAHTAPRTVEEGDDLSTVVHPAVAVRGIHLDWGSSGSRAMPGSSTSTSADGEYGVGAVSCLAAATGAGGHQSQPSSRSTKDVLGLKDEADMIREMEDSRVIAGTTCGDLRIWSVKDVYAAIHLAQNGEDSFAGGGDASRTVHAGSEASSSFIPSTPTRRRLGAGATDAAGATGSGGNNPFNRLKFSLRGRALSGHRGGVTCVDVPSHVYRPDSVVTGGADGLIKLWSLRSSTIGRRSNDASSFMAPSSTAAGQLGRRLATNRGGDALSVLSGHGGRVLCVKTAWHGDRLLSGGADRTIRIWDMMSGGKGTATSGGTGGDAACLHTLSGHFGWVTHVQYWGPNTIVSGSTDRSIALWDARVRNSPLFVLRHHHAPISDLLVGSRTDPLMVSAASDGTVTTWDFRSLSGTAQNETTSADASSAAAAEGQPRHCKVVRQPAAMMSLGQARFSLAKAGPTMLARGDRRSLKTVLSAGSDAVTREWDVSTGHLVNEWNSGHCDALSSLTSLAEASSNNMFGMADSEGSLANRGTITSSWDGTIRIRKRVLK